MKIARWAFILLTAFLLSNCSKNNDVPAPVFSLDDKRTVLLKDIDAHPLPSPYFHFEYDANNYVTKIGFASDLFTYNVEYADKRVTRMTNIRNGNTLNYNYNLGQVSEINEFSGSTGNKVYTYRFTYDNQNLLTHAFWISYANNDQGDIYKRTDLVYTADKNVSSINFYYADSTGNLNWASRQEFSDYDNKTNVDDISLLKSFFESYLFLPQVKLQKNNPAKERFATATDVYQTTNTFHYQGDLPTDKISVVVLNTSPPVQVSTQYSYY